MSKTSLLDQVNYPSDLRKLKEEQLKQLVKEQNGRVRTNEKNIARIIAVGGVIAILLGLL